MTTTAPLSVRKIHEALAVRLATVSNATGYRGEATEVPLKTDGSGQVAPYWVLHMTPGDPDVEPDLGDSVVDLDLLFQVTCVGGTTSDVLGLVDRVNEAIYRWTPEVTGLVAGACHPPPGFRPLVLPDKDFTPHRFFVPLQFVTTATTTT